MKIHIGKNFSILIALITSTWVISLILHDPGLPAILDQTGFKYSDIVHGLFYTRFRVDSSREWFNDKSFTEFIRGVYRCPKPYIDYHFEYPPLIGLLWFTSTCISFNYFYGVSIDDVARVHYYIQSSIILIFSITCSISLYKLGGLMGIRWPRYLLLLSPSMILYLIYNWDIIAISLAILGVLMYLKKKYTLSGILLGASFSTKILTIGVAYYLFLKSTNRRRFIDVAKYVLGFTLTGVLPFLVLYVLSPHGLHRMIQHHLSWYCENCLYSVLIRDIWSPLHRKLFISIATSYVLATTLLLIPRDEYLGEVDSSYLFIYLVPLILFNYVFSPQMFILITPIAILALGSRLLVEYIVADVSNALLILMFFNELRARGDPWKWGSLTQDFALIRNLLLLFILIQVLSSIINKRLRETPSIPDFYSS